MKKSIVFLLMAAILLTATRAATDETQSTPAASSKAVTGTILAVSHVTGDILISQDSGSLLALYGIHRDRLRDIGAGDRVAVTFGENLEVAAIERIDL
jgi:hypothetical protein